MQQKIKCYFVLPLIIGTFCFQNFWAYKIQQQIFSQVYSDGIEVYLHQINSYNTNK